MKRNPGYLFVNIVLPNGAERAVQCSSATQCAKVIKVESKRMPPTTMFLVVAERNDGTVAVVDRWYVSSRGALVHHPYRDAPTQRRHAMADTSPSRETHTLEMMTRRAR